MDRDQGAAPDADEIRAPLLPDICGTSHRSQRGAIPGVGMRKFAILALCGVLGGCFATGEEVKARLGQEYVGKNVDALVIKWGPPTSSFGMNSA